MGKENGKYERIAQLLEGTSWAQDFSWSELLSISRYLGGEKYSSGSLICMEGERSAFLCIIAEGRASVVKESGDGKRKTLAGIRKGQTFGEMSLFDGEPRSASVFAEEETVVLTLSGENLQRMIREKPALGANLLLLLAKTLSRRLRMTSGRLVDYLL